MAWGVAKADHEMLQAAHEDLDRAIQLSPRAARILLQRARVNAALARWPETSADCDEALRLDPDLKDTIEVLRAAISRALDRRLDERTR